MQRKMSAEDFEQAGSLLGNSERRGLCLVAESGHEMIDGVIRRPLVPNGTPVSFTIYHPLRDTPDLFLKFAKIHVSRNQEDAALDWTNRFGLLGGDSEGRFQDLSSVPVSLFLDEAKKAWVVLSLFEATCNKDVPTIKKIVWNLDYRNVVEGFVDKLQEDSPDEEFLRTGLHIAWFNVENTMQLLCRPAMQLEGASGDLADPMTLRRIWEFDNLLGAMYLQMYWLMTSAGELKRCEHCGRIVSLSRPHPEGRKRRSDKRFCDDACRLANHRSKKKL
jgi:hypothetical protein